MKKLLVGLLLMSAGLNVYASDWKYIGLTADGGSGFFIDMSSIKSQNGYLQFWWKEQFIPPRQDGVTELMSLELANCANSRLGTTHEIAYYAGGASRSYKTYLNLDPVAPDTMAEAALKLVCHHKAITHKHKPHHGKRISI